VPATPSSACDFSAISHLANHYFSPPAQQVAQDSIRIMASLWSADDYSDAVKNVGFSVMAIMSAVVAGGTAGDLAIGSSLANQLILCMFDPATEAGSYPTTFPEDFTVALDPALHGAFEVRGAGFDPAGAVLSRPVTAPFSGIAPPLGTTWQDALSDNAPVRALFYGRPGSTATSYDWKVVPRDATFDPPVIVGLCLDPDANPTSIVHESDVGLLAFVDAWFLSTATCSPTALTWPAAGTRFARGLLRLGSNLILPRPLSASSVLNPGGIGGSTGGIGSEFSDEDVPTAAATFLTQPQNGRVGQPIGTSPAGGIVVAITGSGFAIPGTQVSLFARDNNGATVQLTCPSLPGAICTVVTGGDGQASFGNPVLNKTGAYRLEAISDVLGRGTEIGAARSNKFNVRP
jgi:hypothetical protein